MASTTLNDILNWAIPVLVILVFAAAVYVKVPEPFNMIGTWFKKVISFIGEKTSGDSYQTVYRYE